jgi:hypothetical protein
MHLNAEREVLRALMRAGVLKGGEDEAALDELCGIGMGAVFLPCGYVCSLVWWAWGMGGKRYLLLFIDPLYGNFNLGWVI